MKSKTREYPVWKVVTRLKEIYEVKARTPREFASKVQRIWQTLPWEEHAKVIMPNGRATFTLGYWMKPRIRY